MAVITENTETKVPRQAKIKNLLKRDPDTHIIQNDKLTDPIFGNVVNWVVTEKIDGMNIRVHANQNGEFLIGGKTDKSNIPGDLAENIENTFGFDDTDRNRNILDALEDFGYPGYSVTLFGEGYGAGIQSGAHYREDKGFILYDVCFTKDDGRKFFAKFDDVEGIAKALGIPCVLSVNASEIIEVIHLVRDMALGISVGAGKGVEYFLENIAGETSEGIVAYPTEPLYDSFGERIVFKLKVADVAKYYASIGINNVKEYEDTLIQSYLEYFKEQIDEETLLALKESLAEESIAVAQEAYELEENKEEVTLL